MRGTKEKMSTMKKWGILSWGTSIILLILVVIGVFFTDKDMSVLGTVCGLSFAETAVFDGCYAYKERSANKMKMALGFIKELADKYPLSDLSPIIQSVIQD